MTDQAPTEAMQGEAARLAFAAMKARMLDDHEKVIDCVSELADRQMTVAGMMMLLHTAHGFVSMCALALGASPAALWAQFTDGIAAQAKQPPGRS